MPPATTASKPKAEKKIVKLVGLVSSDKRSKSRTIEITFQAPHPKYGKFITHKSVIQAHDEQNASKAGDTVEIVPCRPISKTKKWTVNRIVEKAKA